MINKMMQTDEYPAHEGQQVEKTAAVSSFFYYMWNAWSEEECKAVYGREYEHFWNKWLRYAEHTACGATEKFYSGLSDNYRHRLVERACSLYDGSRRKRKENREDLIKDTVTP